MEYFHSNWLTWRYADGDQTPVKWKIGIDTINVTDAREAAKDAARKIFERHGRVTLLCSGGIDSQVMVLAFKAADVPFDVCIVDYMGFNDHDISTAKAFCVANNIQPTIFLFDALRFLVSGEYLLYAKQFDCQSPQFCVHMKWYEMIHRRMKNPLVLGGNTFYTMIEESNRWRFGYHHGYNQLSYQRAAVPVIGSFLSYTPELAFSLWRHLVPSKHTDNFFQNRAIEHVARVNMYTRAGFNINPPPNKYTGFEQIKNKIDEGNYPGFFETAFRKPILTKAVAPAPIIEKPQSVTDWIATHQMRVARAHGLPIFARRN